MSKNLPVPCPMGPAHVAYFEILPKGYAKARWGRARKNERYVRCPVCGATFPKRVIFPSFLRKVFAR